VVITLQDPGDFLGPVAVGAAQPESKTQQGPCFGGEFGQCVPNLLFEEPLVGNKGWIERSAIDQLSDVVKCHMTHASFSANEESNRQDSAFQATAVRDAVQT
jgi:hypothetical protein